MKTIIRVCVVCKNEFGISPGAQEFFMKRNLFFPTRCPSCRRRKKEKRPITVKYETAEVEISNNLGHIVENFLGGKA